MKKTVRERFDENIAFCPTSGCWLWRGTINGCGYGEMSVNSKNTLAHRLSYELHKGEIPSGLFIDHKCRNRACVNPEHIRLATPAQNLANTGKPINNTSGFKGVRWHTQCKKWQAFIRLNGKFKHIGLYPTPQEASDAYKAAILEKAGEYAGF